LPGRCNYWIYDLGCLRGADFHGMSKAASRVRVMPGTMMVVNDRTLCHRTPDFLRPGFRSPGFGVYGLLASRFTEAATWMSSDLRVTGKAYWWGRA